MQDSSKAADRIFASRSTGFGRKRPAKDGTSSEAGRFGVTWRQIVGALPPFHDLVFLIFLAAFFGFAIQWALTLGG